jgi:hypothetical protein
MQIKEPIIVSPESVFEREVVEAAEAILRARNMTFITIPQFGLDVAYFFKSEMGIKMKILEFKCYAGGRPGGVGFGTPKGQGPQVEILRNSESNIALLEPFIRWALVDALLPIGQKRYALFNSTIAKAGAMGDVKPGKQNNFRVSAFLPYFLKWDEFLVSLEQFLTT